MAYILMHNTFVPVGYYGGVAAGWINDPSAALAYDTALHANQAIAAIGADATAVLYTPGTSDAHAPFEQASNSFVNPGGGAITYNVGTWIGYNANIHAAEPDKTGAIGWFLGLEDNYYDTNTTHYGTEAYLEYWSKDHATVPQFRPLFIRMESTDLNASCNATVVFNIGTDAGGSFEVAQFNTGAPKVLFVLTPTALTTHAAIALFFNGTATFNNAVVLKNNTNLMWYNTGGNAQALIQVNASNQMYIGDIAGTLNNGSPGQVNLRGGGTTIVSMAANALSFFGAANTGKPTVTGSRGGNAALASLLTGLATLGLITDSSSA